MIEYVINTASGCIIYQNHQETKIHKPALSFIKSLCMKHQFTFEGYLKAIKKETHLKYKIPLYIHDALMLIPIGPYKAYDTIWINIVSIKSVEVMQNTLQVTFFHSPMIELKITLNQLKQLMKHLHWIRNTKVKHFHLS